MAKLDRETLLNRAKELKRDESLINSTSYYFDKLSKYNLPIIFSTKHLAAAIGVEYSDLHLIINHRNFYYKNINLKKKNRSFRKIKAPKKILKDVQRWINLHILQKVELNEYITSYRKGKSIRENAIPHLKSEIIIKLDLERFYDHISLKMVYIMFRHLGYPKSISIDLAKLCTINSEEDSSITLLPQGAPTSPYISNIIGMELDRRLNGYAQKKNYRYTRYSDDLTFSTSDINNKISLPAVHNIIKKCGFTVNSKKTRFLKKGNRQEITGITVNTCLSINKKIRKSIETHLHNCLVFGVKHHMEKAKIDKANFSGWLLGNIYYIQSLHPEQAKKMKEKFNMIDWLT